MNTLSKQASEKILELNISLETEKYHFLVPVWNEENKNEWWILSEREYNLLDFMKNSLKKIPAPNLQELFLALEEIGEKLGWKKDKYCNDCGEELGVDGKVVFCPSCPLLDSNKTKQRIGATKQYARRFTDIFLKKGMDAVSEEIINLISKKG